MAEVNLRLGLAQACNPNAPNLQCKDFVDGLCCPVPVNVPNGGDTQAYLAALTAFHNAGCQAFCPGIPCAQNPTAACVADGVSTVYHCAIQ